VKIKRQGKKLYDKGKFDNKKRREGKKYKDKHEIRW